MRCSDCGGTTVWDDEAASEICQDCGTLIDANQVVLTSQNYLNDSTHYATELWDPAAPATLKSLRTSWALAGQGQEARDRKNALTMANFIKSLAISMNAAALSPRATTLFNQAKSIGFFRWGRRAKLVAGACLVIALRESSRPDSIQDISVLLKCAPSLLSRTFIAVTAALQITTKSVDPAVYLTTLQTYLASTIQEGHQVEIGLPAALLKILQPLSLHAVTRTATSLCHVLARLCPSDGTSKPSAASTACAIFMLSLEAEARTTLNALGDLGKALGARVGISKRTVMAQYKAVQDCLASLIERVPWLGKYKGQNGRAKVAKRTIVARGLKDVIKFNEEIFHNILLPDVDLELPPPELAEKVDKSEGVDQSRKPDPTLDPRPSKRRKLHHSLDEASRFLLDPLGPSKPKETSVKPRNPTITPSSFPMTSYVLSTSSLSSLSTKAPTRLQLLAAERGGSDENVIPDDELFAPGELEGFLRDEKEVDIIQRAFGWDESSEEEDSGENALGSGEQAKQRHKVSGDATTAQPRPKKSRLNMEAFVELMKGSGDDDDDEGANMSDDGDSHRFLGLEMTFDDGEYGDYYDYYTDADPKIVYEDEEVSTLHSGTNSRATYSSASSVHNDEIILNWWPPSPGGDTFGGGEAYYEEDPG